MTKETLLKAIDERQKEAEKLGRFDYSTIYRDIKLLINKHITNK